MHPPILAILILSAVLLGILSTACSPPAVPAVQQTASSPESAAAQVASTPASPETPTPFYTSRPRYAPAELVDYTAQTGDTLPGLALRFNTTVAEILEANDFIP